MLSSQLIGGLGPQFSPAFVSYALATPVFVPRGTQFAIVLYSSGSCGTRPGPDGDSYAGGQGYFDARPNQPGWVCLCGFAGPWDLPFQTFVEPGCKVPAVVGQGQTEAVNLISAWGCAPGEPRHEFSSTVPLGSVIAQTPTAGTELAPLAPVSLVFSRGPRPCSVPKLRGLTLKRAKALLHERVCRLGHVRRIHSPLAAGLVIAQHPRGGKVLKPRSKVDVDLSRGPRRR